MRNSASSAPYAFSVLADFLLDRRNDVVEWGGGHSVADLSKLGFINPTMPADLGDTPEPMFQETIKGLSIREVHEPEFFMHFFERSIVG
jgi:hypothetical protein